jgi:hypothetical protein
MNMTEQERAHFEGLLKKFLRDSRNGSAEYSHAHSEAHRKN